MAVPSHEGGSLSPWSSLPLVQGCSRQKARTFFPLMNCLHLLDTTNFGDAALTSEGAGFIPFKRLWIGHKSPIRG